MHREDMTGRLVDLDVAGDAVVAVGDHGRSPGEPAVGRPLDDEGVSVGLCIQRTRWLREAAGRDVVVEVDLRAISAHRGCARRIPGDAEPLPVHEGRQCCDRVAGPQLCAVARNPGGEVRQRLQVGEVEVVLALACPGRDCDVAIPATRTRIRLPGSAVAWYELVGAALVFGPPDEAACGA